MSSERLRRALRKRLNSMADPERAVQQEAYMKHRAKYYGIAQAPMRKAAKEVFAEFPLENAEAWRDAVLTIWRGATRREENYCAITLYGLPKYTRAWLCQDDYPVVEELVTTGAWWDVVDAVATNQATQLLRRHKKETTALMRRWSRHEDLWLRRTAILCQLKQRDNTDEKLLDYTIRGSLGDNNFFARKAIGWALREYSKTKPEWVQAFLSKHDASLSNLSKREACKWLNRANAAG